jgi:hypothetical protein
MLARMAKAFCIGSALALVFAVGPVRAEDILVEDTVRADLAVAAAVEGRFSDAADAVAAITRVDVRDATRHRIAALAARNAAEMEAVELAGKFAGRISNAGVGRDANADIAIALARRNMLDQAESIAAVLDPQRRDSIRAVIAMMLAKQHKVRDAWLTARRTSDIGRRRDGLVTVRGGLGESLSEKAAIGAALGAETQSERVRSLIAVARGLLTHGNRAGALQALSYIPKELRTGFSDASLLEEATGDRAMVLLFAGDVVGARQSANKLRSDGVRRYLLRQIDEFYKFSN